MTSVVFDYVSQDGGKFFVNINIVEVAFWPRSALRHQDSRCQREDCLSWAMVGRVTQARCRSSEARSKLWPWAVAKCRPGHNTVPPPNERKWLTAGLPFWSRDSLHVTPSRSRRRTYVQQSRQDSCSCAVHLMLVPAIERHSNKRGRCSVLHAIGRVSPPLESLRAKRSSISEHAWARDSKR